MVLNWFFSPENLTKMSPLLRIVVNIIENDFIDGFFFLLITFVNFCTMRGVQNRRKKIFYVEAKHNIYICICMCVCMCVRVSFKKKCLWAVIRRIVYIVEYFFTATSSSSSSPRRPYSCCRCLSVCIRSVFAILTTVKSWTIIIMIIIIPSFHSANPSCSATVGKIDNNMYTI